MSSLIEFSKEECEIHWRNFMSRFKDNTPDVSHIIQAINDGFCEQFTEINVADHTNRRTFIMTPCKHFWYFDYLIEKPEELNKDEGEYFDATEFFYEYCNPEFLTVLEKISLEIYG